MNAIYRFITRLFALIIVLSIGFASVSSHAQLDADVVNGEGIAETCSACHGSDGMGYPEGTPRLAGQSRKYMERQLFQLRNSSRARMDIAVAFDSSQEVMTGTSKMRSSARSFDGMDDAVAFLDDQDIVDVAAYFSGLACVPSTKARTEPPKAVTRCKICHGKSGTRITGTIPNIASQSAVYIRRQLKFFRATPKLNEELLRQDTFRFSRIMHTNAKWLTADDITDVSEFFAAEQCK